MEKTKRYLFICEKPVMAKQMQNLFEKTKDKLDYDADFVSVNCHVVDAYNTCIRSAGNNRHLDLINGDAWDEPDGSRGVVNPIKVSKNLPFFTGN